MKTVEIPHSRRYIIERCPYCGRRLAEWYEGDSVVTLLHPKAGVTMRFGLIEREAERSDAGEPIEGSSRCYRTICRIRRRLDRNHP